jgi:hypothetical protein
VTHTLGTQSCASARVQITAPRWRSVVDFTQRPDKSHLLRLTEEALIPRRMRRRIASGRVTSSRSLQVLTSLRSGFWSRAPTSVPSPVVTGRPPRRFL